MTLVEQLRSGLSKGIVDFSYEKLNGEWREARGTCDPECIELANGMPPKGTGTEKIGTIAYWDLGVNGWRSCREDKIIDVRAVRTIEEYKQSLEENA